MLTCECSGLAREFCNVFFAAFECPAFVHQLLALDGENLPRMLRPRQIGSLGEIREGFVVPSEPDQPPQERRRLCCEVREKRRTFRDEKAPTGEAVGALRGA